MIGKLPESKPKFHDLVQLLDSRRETYDEVACFARDLDPADVGACTGWPYTGGPSGGTFTFGFAYGNAWRNLKVHEGLGIAVLSSPDHRHPVAAMPDGSYLSTVLRTAGIQSPAPSFRAYALLRKREQNRNLLLTWESGQWQAADTTASSFRSVKAALWADVEPRYFEETAETGTTGFVHPFLGADAHPGELCVAGTEVAVATILRRFADGYSLASAVEALGLGNAPVGECLRGLADWLKAQTWTGPGDVTPEDCAKLEGICAEQQDPDPVCPNPVCGEVCAQTDIVDGTLRCPHCGCGSPYPFQRPVARIKSTKNFHGHGFRCRKCEVVFPADGNVKDGIVTCPGCKTAWLDEKRCGTCDFGADYTCNFLRVHIRTSSSVWSDDGGFLTDDNGPPWPDCRFWRPQREQT